MTRKKKKEFSVPAGIGIGLGVGAVTLMLVLLLLSVLTAKGTIPENMMRTIGTIACFLAVIIGALQCGRMVPQRKLLCCSAVGIGMFLLTFAIGRGVSDAAKIDSMTVATLIAFMLGSIAAGALCTKKRKRKIR